MIPKNRVTACARLLAVFIPSPLVIFSGSAARIHLHSDWLEGATGIELENIPAKAGWMRCNHKSPLTNLAWRSPIRPDL
jgi:hypothetical protein